MVLQLDILTSRVFAIRHDDDEFGIATTKSHAISGIGITVTSFGEGNAHTFEMVKSNEKALMAIDGIVQTPISNTNITHTVNNNCFRNNNSSNYFCFKWNFFYKCHQYS